MARRKRRANCRPRGVVGPTPTDVERHDTRAERIKREDFARLAATTAEFSPRMGT